MSASDLRPIWSIRKPDALTHTPYQNQHCPNFRTLNLNIPNVSTQNPKIPNFRTSRNSNLQKSRPPVPRTVPPASSPHPPVSRAVKVGGADIRKFGFQLFGNAVNSDFQVSEIGKIQIVGCSYIRMIRISTLRVCRIAKFHMHT